MNQERARRGNYIVSHLVHAIQKNFFGSSPRQTAFVSYLNSLDSSKCNFQRRLRPNNSEASDQELEIGDDFEKIVGMK